MGDVCHTKRYRKGPDVVSKRGRGGYEDMSAVQRRRREEGPGISVGERSANY